MVETNQLTGRVDAHCHLDRANTASDEYWHHARLTVDKIAGSPLSLKQRATGKLHTGLAYQPEELQGRMDSVIQQKYDAGERQLWAIMDTSPDIDRTAVDAGLKLREMWADRLDIKIGGYPIFGFKTIGSDRHRLIQEVAGDVQFLVGLPERDVRGGHELVGFNGHIKLLLEIAHEHNLPVHFHLDQANHPDEHGTETLIEAIRWLGSPQVDGLVGPTVWAVHVISPSCYNEDRFKRLVDGLLETNIGVIVCPHAAISMRQLRPVQTPTHNSIARVRELLEAGVPMRFGTDNIGDIFVGLIDPLLQREIDLIGSAVRFYDSFIWESVACGRELDDVDRNKIEQSLLEDQQVFAQYQ